ncbi:MAG: hypothetical protein KAW56_16600 [Candidatus Marinimicrobia bacterium]|nr:hypothetical protein [Candidatus Neomarinimicrobiota bacterium]
MNTKGRSLGQTGDRQVSRLEETKMKNVLGIYRLVNMFLNSFLPVPEARQTDITNSYFRVFLPARPSGAGGPARRFSLAGGCDSWADELNRYITLLLEITRGVRP